MSTLGLVADAEIRRLKTLAEAERAKDGIHAPTTHTSGGSIEKLRRALGATLVRVGERLRGAPIGEPPAVAVGPLDQAP